MEKLPPLTGIKVLDLASPLPGSLCTKILAEFGAEVIKVEDPAGGDGFRHYEPKVNDVGLFFHLVNQGKKGVALDIKTPQGVSALRRMMLAVDVVVESFRPRFLARKGLGYDDICRDNPQIIYCSLTGFGQGGPYQNRPSHDLNILSLAGMLDLLGNSGAPPIVPTIQVAGAGGALQAAVAILLALLQVQKTGKGTHIDVALLDCLTPFAAMTVAPVVAGAETPQRGETFLGGGSACYNVYETSEGRYFSVGCIEAKYWVNFCKAVGREDFSRDIFAPPPRQKEMIAAINAITKTRTLAAWVEILENADVCFAPVKTLPEALDDEQIRHRRLWDVGEAPNVIANRFPARFSHVDTVADAAAPVLGRDTATVLAEFGFSAMEIAEITGENGDSEAAP